MDLDAPLRCLQIKAGEPGARAGCLRRSVLFTTDYEAWAPGVGLTASRWQTRLTTRLGHNLFRIVKPKCVPMPFARITALSTYVDARTRC